MSSLYSSQRNPTEQQRLICLNCTHYVEFLETLLHFPTNYTVIFTVIHRDVYHTWNNSDFVTYLLHENCQINGSTQRLNKKEHSPFALFDNYYSMAFLRIELKAINSIVWICLFCRIDGIWYEHEKILLRIIVFTLYAILSSKKREKKVTESKNWLSLICHTNVLEIFTKKIAQDLQKWLSSFRTKLDRTN